MIFDMNSTSLYRQGIAYPGLAISWTETGKTSGVSVPVFLGGPAIGTEKKRRKRRTEEFNNWPAMIWPTPKPPEGTTVQPVEVMTPDSPKPVLEREIMGTPVPSAAMVGAVRRNAPSTPLLDTATRRRIMEMQQRLRMEIEDEEALLMLGAFDD